MSKLMKMMREATRGQGDLLRGEDRATIPVMEERERAYHTALATVWGLLLVAVVAVMLAGCSHAQFTESYDGNGNLASRSVRSTNALNWIESQFAAEQVDGAYNLGMGTRGGVDPQIGQIAQVAAITAQTITGMSSLRRATPDSAFGPVSVDGIGASGLVARPITEAQAAALADNNARRVEIERIRAEAERLREELAMAQAHAEGLAGENEQLKELLRPVAPQPAPDAPGVTSREVR